MASQVVIPFPRAERGRGGERLPHDAATSGRLRTGIVGRIAAAFDVARAVVETLSYLSEPRIRPTRPALPERTSA